MLSGYFVAKSVRIFVVDQETVISSLEGAEIFNITYKSTVGHFVTTTYECFHMPVLFFLEISFISTLRLASVVILECHTVSRK